MANILASILPNAKPATIRSDSDKVALTGLMLLKLDARPNVAGTAAPIGSIGVFDNAGTAELWFKSTAADGGWTQITVP